ncbi:MAG: J domain-containing protein [Thermoflexales bacterium]|nr:J domain-containing protein [Thermoflexales bacterium]
MAAKDYYKILGVDRQADSDTIKKAYRKLARQHHPDVNKGDKQSEERFKEINAAYETLSDPDKRRMYDQLGPNYERMQQGGGAGGFGGMDWQEMFRQAQSARANRAGGQRSGPGEAGFDPSAIFETLFGNMAGAEGTGARAGADLEQEVELTLQEAFHGTTRLVRRANQEIEVSIPPGVKTGSRVRVKGQGARSARAAGDLYLVVQVAADPVFERRDDDLYRTQHVDVFTALLGGEVTAETLAGNLVVRIPPGTSSGKQIRLRGKGMPRLAVKGEHGDLYLKIQISVPANLADEDRRALEKMARRYS